MLYYVLQRQAFMVKGCLLLWQEWNPVKETRHSILSKVLSVLDRRCGSSGNSSKNTSRLWLWMCCKSLRAGSIDAKIAKLKHQVWQTKSWMTSISNKTNYTNELANWLEITSTSQRNCGSQRNLADLKFVSNLRCITRMKVKFFCPILFLPTKLFIFSQ